MAIITAKIVTIMITIAIANTDNNRIITVNQEEDLQEENNRDESNREENPEK